MIKIKAQFIGASSEGYITGKTYELIINNERKKNVFKNMTRNTISRLDDTGVVIYETVTAFLNNWTNIERVF